VQLPDTDLQPALCHGHAGAQPDIFRPGGDDKAADAFGKRRDARRPVEMFLVHRPARGTVRSRALAPGVQALAWEEFVAAVLP
jgi:hypothetical protein